MYQERSQDGPYWYICPFILTSNLELSSRGIFFLVILVRKAKRLQSCLLYPMCLDMTLRLLVQCCNCCYSFVSNK